MDDPPQLNLSFESTSLSLPLSLPDTPTSPITPLDPKPKKSNPLNDLIDTEKAYSDLLGGVIKKVAAAWSRSNMPPPKLDTMFRSIESVYRSNRSLLSKLKEIGTSSPKALGDLLIRWVDDLEGPYTNYCTQYRFGFDEWEPVKSNARLAPILATFSAANPPPSSDTSLWTLDDLFLLPKGRLKYYKKLYTRLLKSTQAGRSDHRLLVDALEKLEKLLKILDERENVQVVTPIMPERPLSPVKKDEEDESEDNDNDNDNDMDEAVVNAGVSKDELDPTVVRDSDVAPTSTSEASSFRGSEGSGFERLSQDPPSSSTSRGSSSTMTTPVTDLERRLLTQRTLDIFTMNPKALSSPPRFLTTG
ncbi:hypothetical protein PQX77_004176 [Marasmius sp. AFHP31]|nr:hypothetical protein PQX77_004176 [Marasmius sp. AFHP31]